VQRLNSSEADSDEVVAEEDEEPWDECGKVRSERLDRCRSG
jgi:hypothetical protein